MGDVEHSPTGDEQVKGRQTGGVRQEDRPGGWWVTPASPSALLPLYITYNLPFV